MDCQSDTAAQTVEGVRLSFDEAFVAHHRVVYRYAYALTRDPGLAEDIAHPRLRSGDRPRISLKRLRPRIRLDRNNPQRHPRLIGAVKFIGSAS